MDTIELWNGTTKALIDPLGAWLTNVSDDLGDVLYPKRSLKDAAGETKIRGGCHVCLPNFGAGGDSGMLQHGFARQMPWTISQQQQSAAVLTLANGKDGYEALHSTLTYILNESSITVELELVNQGDAPLRVAPGFHPYFALNPDEGRVTLNGLAHDTQDLAGTEFFEDKNTMKLELRRRLITITSDNLPKWAFWTDQLGDYVCCEPTVGGYTFLQEPSDQELLQPHKTLSYAMTISW